MQSCCQHHTSLFAKVAITGATATNSFNCAAHDLLPFGPLWSIGGGLPSPSPISEVVGLPIAPALLSCASWLGFFFELNFVNGFQKLKEQRKTISFDKKAAQFKNASTRSEKCRCPSKVKGATAARYWSVGEKINSLAECSPEEVAGLILCGEKIRCR